MGTRSDFYIGRGENAQWLGSYGWDGHPESMPEALLRSKTVKKFTEAVLAYIEENEGILPDAGWPWPWDDSNLTDHAYAFDNGEVLISGFGRGWLSFKEYTKLGKEYEKACAAWDKASEEDEGHGYDEPYPEDPRSSSDKKTCVFPNMKDIKNVDYGPASGVITIGIKK